MGLNDSAWGKLFEKYDILGEIEQRGHFVVTADQIKEFREPRLMTKFDHKVNLPEIFYKNKLSILPLTRGSYIISSFSAYENFPEPNNNIQRVSIPSHIQSLIPQFIVSEAIALNCAYACGILQDFLEDEELIPTVSGRMSSGAFNFSIDTAYGDKEISVLNSQIEIDAAYEGINYLSLFEAKKELSDDFLVRQLYYPFRTWYKKISKPVKSVFLTFSNGTFSLYQYCFQDPYNYNSLKLVKQKSYVIEAKICLADIENILDKVIEIKEPQISFPQADNMSRIINLAELLYEKPMTRNEITERYAFDARQTNYYTDAGRYLGLIDKISNKNGIVFKLSDKGNHFMQLPYKERQLALASQILAHKPFKEVLKIHLRTGEMPNRNTIINIMKRSNLYNIRADSTYFRRASTIMCWVNWILGIIDSE